MAEPPLADTRRSARPHTQSKRGLWAQLMCRVRAHCAAHRSARRNSPPWPSGGWVGARQPLCLLSESTLRWTAHKGAHSAALPRQHSYEDATPRPRALSSASTSRRSGAIRRCASINRRVRIGRQRCCSTTGFVTCKEGGVDGAGGVGRACVNLRRVSVRWLAHHPHTPTHPRRARRAPQPPEAARHRALVACACVGGSTAVSGCFYKGGKPTHHIAQREAPLCESAGGTCRTPCGVRPHRAVPARSPKPAVRHL